jgi:hypothetical protein
LFVAIVLHLPAHAVVLSGVQHVSFTHTSEDDAQLTVAPDPQATAWPQLFIAVPQVLPWHVVDGGSGTHPQAPPVHVSPASQLPQSIDCPQLSLPGPHRFWHQVDGGVGEQQLSFDVQTPPSPHDAAQVIVCPQLLVTVWLHLPAQAVASSGVQHVPSGRHTSPFVPHIVPPLGPQATVCPQLFVAELQFLPAQVVVAGSGSHPHAPCAVHVAPASQPPQSTGLLQLSNCLPHRFAQ